MAWRIFTYKDHPPTFWPAESTVYIKYPGGVAAEYIVDENNIPTPVGTWTVGAGQWITGTGIPMTPSNNGNYYRDDSNQDVYYSAGGSWSLVGNLLGGGGGGGMGRIITNITNDTVAGAAANTEYVYICIGTFFVKLPTAVSNKNKYTVINSGTGSIQVLFTGAETCNGSVAVPMNVRYQSRDFISNNTNWVIA